MITRKKAKAYQSLSYDDDLFEGELLQSISCSDLNHIIRNETKRDISDDQCFVDWISMVKIVMINNGNLSLGDIENMYKKWRQDK